MCPSGVTQPIRMALPGCKAQGHTWMQNYHTPYSFTDSFLAFSRYRMAKFW